MGGKEINIYIQTHIWIFFLRKSRVRIKKMSHSKQNVSVYGLEKCLGITWGKQKQTV